MKFEEKIERLLEVGGEMDQKKLEAAVQAEEEAKNAHREKRSADSRTQWFSTKRQLRDLVHALWQKHMVTGKLLRNRAEAFECLKERGYKISRTQVYSDVKQGKLRVQLDGTILLSDVDLYARAYLSGLATAGGGMESLAKKKLSLEIERLAQQVEIGQLHTERERGSVVARKDFYLELAARAAILDSAIRNLFYSKAGSWVSSLRGDPARIPQWLEEAQRDLDEQLAAYAAIDEFEVTFDVQSDPTEQASPLA
jgi:hypothetical protein